MVTKKSNVKAATSLVRWLEKFAGYAKTEKQQVAAIAGGGPTVKFGPGSIVVAGGQVPGAKLECIVVASCAFNAWYGGRPYDPDDPQPPECYAFAEVAGPDMAPHKDCQDKQSDTCAECPRNQFGTATTGRGKDCGNNVRLALALSKDIESAEDVAGLELALAKVSPTNLKAWKGYVNAVADAPDGGRPTWALVTEIQSKPVTTGRAGHALEFRKVETVDDPAILDALEARHLKAQDTLQQPFGPPTERVKKPAAGQSRKFAATKVAKR
jgi:hypothetical protein